MTEPETKKGGAEKGKLIELTSDFKALARVKKQLTEVQMTFIKDTVAPTLNDNEIILFLYRASIARLDPLNGEMFAYVSKGKDGKRQLVMFAGRDGKRVTAERTGLILYIEVEPVYIDKDGKKCDFWEGELKGAVAKGKRKDKEREYKVSVPLTEYKQDKFIWNTKPETMIKKVAESQLLSMMFPNQLGGVYDHDSENFINGNEKNEKEPVKLEGGDKPASKTQIATIKALDVVGMEYFKDGKPKRTFKPTKQEAADIIKKLTQKRSKKGK